MKPLYKTVAENQFRILDTLEVDRLLATPEAIHAAERRLGVPLPKTFKDFAAQVGSASWPATIFAIEALAPYPADWDRPLDLIAFATDLGGNDWCFDTRKLDDEEYAIIFWDHEAPPDARALADECPATPFDEWLEDLVSDELRNPA